jgi:hypothetical protein
MKHISTSSVLTAAAAPAPDRACGTCTLCCKIMAIAKLDKPANKWCQHCAPGRGCKIYADRPEECRTFYCNWITDSRLGPQWKPEKSKFVLITTREGTGIEIRVDPNFPTAWRNEPFYSQILHWAHDAAAMEGIVVVYVGKIGTLITPEGEFPLGEVTSEHRIVRELSSGRVVRAYVEKIEVPG